MSNFEHSYALIIGINNYNNGISPLKNAVSDATEIARILETQHHYNVTLLLDEAATIGQLRQVLETELPKQIQAGDRFLFYFAGHGIALNGEDGPEGYLVPENAKFGNVSNYLPMSEVNKALLQLPCRHFLGILDCCFAGAFRWSSTRKAIPVELGTLHRERFDRFIQDPAWQVVTSAACDQSAWDAFDLKDDRGQKGVHSPFAGALIEALEGKADAFPPAAPGKPAGDGVITASELYLYLRDRVEIATETRAIRQTPGIHCLKKHDKGEYIFLTPGHALNLPPAPPLDVSKNPYRGLLPFEEKHSQLFFGRSALTQKLCEFVMSHSLTVVLGASGSGKSSLVKAGVIPKIRQSQDGKIWFILPPFRPGESPFKALNNVLASVNLPAIATVDRAKSSGWFTPAERLANWFKEHPQANLLMVVDQFEELITLCRNDLERQQFLVALKEAIATYPQQLHIVLTLRSDFEPQFRNTVLEKDWQTARFVVPAMTREELRQAIEEPASARVMYFEPHELVEQLIDEVANMPGALPLLSFALSELYLKYLKRQEDAKNRGETIDRAIAQVDYQELGGVTRSLTQRADREYEELVDRDPAYEQTIRNVMLRMVAVGGELARRRVPISELEYPEPENTRVKTVIQRFSDARLLTNGTDSENQTYVEPAHDALVRGWQRLLEWKQQDLENVLLQRGLTPIANQWASSSKKGSYRGLLWDDDPRLPLAMKLLCGSAYKDTWLNFLKWMCGDKFWKSQSNDFGLNSNESKFVTDSFDRKFRKRINTVGLTSLVITSLAGLTIFALIQAQLSGLRERVAVARNLILTKPVDALILAIQATHKASTTFPQVLSAAQSNLFATLEASRELNVLRGHEGAVTTLAFSPNSPTIVSGGKDGTVRLWNLKGEFQILGRHESEVTTVAFSPKDNNTFISGGRDGTVRRWNLKGEFQILGRHEGGVTAVAFSPTDSNTFISSGRDSTVRLWNLKGSYKIIGNLRDAAKEDGKSIILSVAFSPDGKTIASGGDGFVLRLWHLDRITMPMELSLKGTSKEEADNAGFGCITSIAFSSDGNEMIAGQAMQSFPYKETLSKLSSLNYNDKPQITEIAAHEFSTYSVAFNPRNNVFVSGGDDGTLQLRNLNGELITQPLIGHVKLGGIQCYQLYENTGNNYSSITAVSFSHNGELIASAGADGTVRIWSTEAFPSVKSIQIRQNGDADAFQVSSPVYEEFESNLKLFRPDGSAIQLVKRNDALEIQEIVASPDAFKPENDRTEVFYSSDGKVMALVEQGNKIQIRDNAGLPIGKSFIVRDKVQHLAFNSDRRRVVVVGDTNMVEVRDFEGDRIGSPFLHQGEVHSIALSLDGQIIVTANSVGYPQGGGDSTLRLWDIEGNFIVSFKQPGALFNSCGQYCSLLAFSSSGKSIISYSYINHPSVRILPGNWQALFSIACERLRNHPILKAPKDDNSRDVKDLCKGY